MILETVTYTYGQDLSGRETPAVPEKERYYGVWEEIGESRITIDHAVEAIYTPYITTLASDAIRDSVHPVLLLEGRFDGQAAMRVEQAGGNDDTERWTVTLAGTDVGEHRIRFTPPAEWKNVSLFLLTENGKVPLQWEWDGSCCVFTTDGASFTIETAAQGDSFSILWVTLAVGFFAVLILCFFLIRKHQLRKPRRAAASRP